MSNAAFTDHGKSATDAIEEIVEKKMIYYKHYYGEVLNNIDPTGS